MNVKYQKIPKYWYHDPLLVDGDGHTLAMLYAKCDALHGLDKYWYHDPLLKNKSGNTVAMLSATSGSIT